MRTALFITNDRARRVTPRLKAVIAKALSADLALEEAETKDRHHATEIAREVAERGLDLVIVFGGDGTVNEVANGLAGSATALAVLPGGARNAVCRNLGIPADIVEATAILLNRIQERTTRRINVGRAGERYFVISCGVGFDAAVTEKLEEHWLSGGVGGVGHAVTVALGTALGSYRGRSADIAVRGTDLSENVVSAVIANAPAYTYLGRWPMRPAPEAEVAAGLDLVALRRFPVAGAPRLLWSMLGRGGHLESPKVVYRHDLVSLDLVCDVEPFPVQVDGEFAGRASSLEVSLVPDGLAVLA